MTDGEYIPWPCTIIPARYGGAYEEQPWLALGVHYEDIPPEVYGGDIDCNLFFNGADTSISSTIGRGQTPNEAFEDLLRRLGDQRERRNLAR